MFSSTHANILNNPFEAFSGTYESYKNHIPPQQEDYRLNQAATHHPQLFKPIE